MQHNLPPLPRSRPIRNCPHRTSRPQHLKSAAPALSISKSGGYVMISSSAGSLDGFDLQVRDSFSPGSQWTTIASQALVAGNQYAVPSAGSRFFRLQKRALPAIIFGPGETNKTITIVVNGDTLNEADETFFVNLTNSVNAIISAGHGTVTIRNDDTPPQLTINNVIVTEGDTGTTNAVVTVSLSAPSGLPVSVDWATADGTATAPGDYIAGTGTLSFAAEQSDSKLSTQNQPPHPSPPCRRSE